MSKKAKPASATNTNPCSTSTVITRQSANEHFTSQLKEYHDSRHHVQTFLTIMNAVQASKPAFTIQDVFMFNGAYALPAHVIKDLFERWVTCMSHLHKVERLPSVYDSGELILTISV